MEYIQKTFVLNVSRSLPWTHEDYRLLQPIWDQFKLSPGFTIVFSILFYFIAVLPWTIIDLYGKDWKWIQKYKIQPDKQVTWPLMKKAIVLTIWNHILYVLPLTVAFWVFTPPVEQPRLAPPVLEMVWHCIGAIAIFDLEFYIWHYIHHKVRFLYKHVHALHHQYRSPNAWVTQYFHPMELITLGFFSTTSPWVFNSHPLTCYTFQFFSLLAALDNHIGYDLPFMPHHWFPFWGGSVKHDMHHQKPLTNYAPFFNYLDKIFGTYCPHQMAGGYRPKSLLDWEKKDKESKKQLREQRERLMAAPEEHPFLN